MKVELRNISKRFGPVLANDDVSLTVEAGMIQGLLGENGAGKSTLVKILSGFITRDRGQVLLNGQAAELRTPQAAIRAGIGMLHQDPLDFPPLSVLENFMVGKQGSRFNVLLPKRAARREFRQLADPFNFALDLQETVGNLSVGERQQLELLRLLSLGVQTLILDEPTTGISPSQKAALFAAMRTLAAQGKSMIFVSHKLEDVEVLCDRVTVMRTGKVVGEVEMPPAVGTQLIAPKLVSLMFGRELAQPSKPKTAQAEPALQLNQILIKDDRLSVAIDKLTVQRGEVIGLAGLEGSGQRLLLLLCAGLQPAVAGTIRINATDLTQRSYQDYRKAGVGFLPADRLKEGLVRGLTIHEHVVLRWQASRRGLINWKDTFAATAQAINLFNIRGKPDTQVERLSGGNQQRTQLALLPVPLNLLLMEHPTRGLDIESALWVWQQLTARCQTGTTILFTSSDLDEIMQYSDRVIVLSGGTVSEPISTAQLTTESLGQMIGGKIARVANR